MPAGTLSNHPHHGMDWLQDLGQDLGKKTRRGLAHAAKHTGGILETVGAAVEHVGTAADSILPPVEHAVQCEVSGAHGNGLPTGVRRTDLR